LDKNTISDNYHKVLERIEKSANSAGRDTQDVKLVVVTKGQSIQSVRNAFSAGIRVFGENYVQEAINKIESFSEEKEIEWHMIGHIQSRKARHVCEHFNWVESLDSIKLAKRLNRFSDDADRVLPVLLEINVSGEESKFGFPAWKSNLWDDLLQDLEQILALSNLAVCGLMSMPPLFADPEKVRPYFQRLRKLQGFLRKGLPQISWNELSMGMSGDFEVAIQEGATIIRVGTAIMGSRT
jgi:pyridoxal phosphate enzyme (YggS family)